MKNAWPIGIIAFFALFIPAMIGFVVWSTHQRTDLVSKDYYDQEMRYQQRIDAEQRTMTEGAAPKIAHNAAAGRIELRFPASDALARAQGAVTLYRPSEAALDVKSPLAVDAAGIMHLAATTLQPGLWRVKAEWSVDGKAYYAEDSVVIP